MEENGIVNWILSWRLQGLETMGVGCGWAQCRMRMNAIVPGFRGLDSMDSAVQWAL